MMTVPELDKHIADHIQGGFGQADMALLKEEIEKLESGDIHVQIGIDEGRSLRTAHEYAPEGVWIIGIDIHDPTNTPGLNRAQFMEKEGMVGIGKRCFYIHGDADEFSDLLWNVQGETIPDGWVDLLFIDGHHGYEDVKKNTLKWESWVKFGGVILFHDIDHLETRKFLNDHYGLGQWEDCHGKIGRVRR